MVLAASCGGPALILQGQGSRLELNGGWMKVHKVQKYALLSDGLSHKIPTLKVMIVKRKKKQYLQHYFYFLDPNYILITSHFLSWLIQ